MSVYRKLFALLALVSAAACRDAAGPASAAGPAAAPTLAIGVGHLEGIESFQVHPGRERAFVIADHRIYFEADAICDPKVSTYGPGEWDAPCEAAQQPVRITATASRDAQGRPRVDFEPALRFRPDRKVTLYLMDKAASADTANVTILWVDPQGALVDEAASDSSVATRRGENGFLYRRIKHFSGYQLAAGRLSVTDEGGGEVGAEVDLLYRLAAPGAGVAGPEPLQSGHVVATGRQQRARSAMWRRVQRLLGRQ